MEDLRTIRAAFGTTINDVVLAACAASLRRWLLDRDALPTEPLVANVPIAVRAPEGDTDVGNRVSMLRVHLPVQEPDPAERLRLIHAETSVGKQQHRGSGGNVFQHFSDLVLNLTVPWVLTHAIGLYSRSHAADYVPALWNVVISNVPGPRGELYCGGARVSRIYPFGPVQHGSGLNLTVISTETHMCLGALACPALVPNLKGITDEFVRDIGRLRELAARA
jgi:WS/DGAT/MGAT family acyltransferase